jgi:hypothetical protein
MESAQNILMESFSWTPDTTLEIVIERGGEELSLKANLGTPKVEKFSMAPLKNTTPQQLRLREAWLKG